MPAALVVFDLAGVLLDFRGVESVSRLCAQPDRVPAAFDRFWATSPWADALYTGSCTPDAFAVGAVQALALDVSHPSSSKSSRRGCEGPIQGRTTC